MNELIRHVPAVMLVVLLIARFVLAEMQERKLQVTDVEKIREASRQASKFSNWNFWLSILILVDVLVVGYFWFFAK